MRARLLRRGVRLPLYGGGAVSAEEWLAERARIEQAATEGPWEINGAGEYVSGVGLMVGPGDDGVSGADVDFITDARTAMPKMRAALEAVLALHWGEPYAQGPGYCAECEHQWPCPTVAAITAALGAES